MNVLEIYSRIDAITLNKKPCHEKSQHGLKIFIDPFYTTASAAPCSGKLFLTAFIFAGFFNSCFCFATAFAISAANSLLAFLRLLSNFFSFTLALYSAKALDNFSYTIFRLLF